MLGHIMQGKNNERKQLFSENKEEVLWQNRWHEQASLNERILRRL